MAAPELGGKKVDDRMALIALQFGLWIWFLGCIITYRAGRRLLVEGVGLKSAECLMLCLYSIGIAAFWLVPAAGRWILLFVLVLWFAVQFFCHWYYTIFGASEKKLQGYNACFEKTIRLIPASKTRLIPDLYHMVLHLLILANIVVAIITWQRFSSNGANRR